MAFSSTLAGAVLAWAFTGAPVARPGSPVLGLFTGPYGSVGSAEPGPTTGYERRGLVFGPPAYSPTGALISTNAMASFPAALLDWPEVTHWAIFDSSTNGLMAHGILPHAIKVYAGETLDVPAGGIVEGIGQCPS